MTEWHVNADEVPLFDYNDTVLDAPGEAAFERESTFGGPDALYAADERRSSDHDPVVVGLDLASLTIDQAAIVTAARGGGRLAAVGTTGRPTAACPTLELRVGDTTIPIGRTTLVGQTCVSLTSRGVVSFDPSTGSFAVALVLPASFRLTGDDLTFVLRVDGTTYGVVRDGQRTGPVWVAT